MYRTKTYIAGDWTGDRDLIDELYKWNDSDCWALHFADAHDITQARDSSLYCSIKRSLWERLKASKTFVLVVGAQTDRLTKGGCQYCESYNSWNRSCARGYSCDYRSYIEYECEMAKLYEMKVVVIYNFSFIRKEKCPQILRDSGVHISGYYWDNNGEKNWNYWEIKQAIMGN